MPFEVSNPVKFYAGGDTTSQAIGKHIAEIARIYDILNDGLDSAKSVVVVLSPNTVLKDEQLGITPAPLEIKRGNGVQRWSELPDGIRLAQAIDNLTSDDWVAPLSARQGKLLKELIDAVPKTEVVDDLTTGGSGKALSAEQGKALKALIDTLTTPVPGPPGPKGIEWRGAWSGTAEYRKDDAVSYHGGSYIALKPSTGEPPTNAEFWGVLSAKGADGAGSGDMVKAVYDPDGDGKVSSAVAADHAGTADTATRAGTADAVAWDNVTGKPEKFTCDIVDALDSDRADAALSARQGKALKTLVDGIKKTEVVDTLDSDRIDAALSARQGKGLKGMIDEKAGLEHQHGMADVAGLSEALGAKADLVGGKVPESQLPDRGNNGALIPTTDTFKKIVERSSTRDRRLPDGGTWLYYYWNPKPSSMDEQRDVVVGTGAGGSALPSPLMPHLTTQPVFGFLWKIQ